MNVDVRLRAVVLGAFLVAAALPVCAATGEMPDLGPNVTVGRLPVGGTVIVRPAQGAPVAAIELWYRAPSTGFGPKPAPGIARLAAQMVAASKPIVGEALGTAIGDLGGRLGITAYGDSVAISASVPASAARNVVKLMTTAYFAPVVTEDGFQEARREVVQEAELSAIDPETVTRDAVFAQLFSAGPQHFPALGDPKDIAAIALADAKAFATRAFRAQNATLVLSGDVDASVAEAAVGGRPDPSADPEAAAEPELATSVAPVTKTFGEVVGGYGWIGPAIADTREATAMDFIADYLFRPDDGYVTRQVDQKYPHALLLGQFITLHDPGVMFVVYSGRDDTPALRSLVDDGFAHVQLPMTASTFAAALESFKYHLLSDLQTPSELADNFGWYAVEGAPDYAPGANGDSGTYFKAADSLTPEFVASVATKYFSKAPATVTLRPGTMPRPSLKPQ
jgi:predicted Zn-dependent peptidase